MFGFPTLLAFQSSPPAIQFRLAPLFEDSGLSLALMGILVVFAALALVVTFISLLPRMLGNTAPQPAAEIQPAAAGLELDDELPEEIQVVIAAAVSEFMDRPQRIVKIRGLGSSELGWSLEGRMQQHLSHRIQHRDRS